METSNFISKATGIAARTADDRLRMTEEEFASFMNSIAPGRVVSIDLMEGSSQ